MDQIPSTEDFHVLPAHLALLEQILHDSESQPEGVDAKSFRAKHVSSWDDLEEMQRIGLIVREGVYYQIRFASLTALRNTPRVESLLHLCSVVYCGLQDTYRRQLDKPLPVSDLASSVDLPLQQVIRALAWLKQLPLWSTISNTLNSPDAHFTPSEAVLKYPSLDAMIQEQRRQMAAHQVPELSLHDDLFGALAFTPGATESASWSTPHWVSNLDIDLKAIFDEVYHGLNSGLLALPSMGLRTIVDLVLNKLVGDIGPFSRKLDALVDNKIVTPERRKVLEATLEVGHASAHRGYIPDATAIRETLTIVEHLVFSFYLMPGAADKLKASVPSRKKSP